MKHLGIEEEDNDAAMSTETFMLDRYYRLDLHRPMALSFSYLLSRPISIPTKVGQGEVYYIGKTVH